MQPFGMKFDQIEVHGLSTHVGLLDLNKIEKPLHGFIDNSCTATRARQAVERCCLGPQHMCMVF